MEGKVDSDFSSVNTFKQTRTEVNLMNVVY